MDGLREVILGKKGDEIILLDLRSIVEYFDYFMICSGSSPIHNRTIADAVTEYLRTYDIMRISVQGYESGDWILIDGGAIVVHIFLADTRRFYHLEELWGAAEQTKL